MTHPFRPGTVIYVREGFVGGLAARHAPRGLRAPKGGARSTASVALRCDNGHNSVYVSTDQACLSV